MTIPKMPERKDEYYPEDSKWNEAIDIAEKRIEAIVERLREMRILTISPLPIENKVNTDIDNLIQELQPPEQSPNEPRHTEEQLNTIVKKIQDS